MSVSVALLLPGFVSVEPAPAVTAAVLTRMPVADGLTVPLTVSVSALAAPGARLESVKLTRCRPSRSSPQAPVPVTAQLTVTPVMAAGTVSVRLKPVAADGPAFVTVIV